MAKAGLHLTVSCTKCKINFIQSRSDQEYCSQGCYRKQLNEFNKSKRALKETKICEVCKRTFKPTTNTNKHCSGKCTYQKRLDVIRRNSKTGLGRKWGVGQIRVARKTCSICGNEFYCPPCIEKRSINAGKFCSNKCYGKYFAQNPHLVIRGSKFRSGIRKDLPGFYFRSKWEANYSRYLDLMVQQKQIKKWEYEVDVFEVEFKGKVKHYLPDFKIFKKGKIVEYHEVKGYLDERGKTKIESFKKLYPKLNFTLIDSCAYREIEKKYKNILMFWEQ